MPYRRRRRLRKNWRRKFGWASHKKYAIRSRTLKGPTQSRAVRRFKRRLVQVATKKQYYSVAYTTATNDVIISVSNLYHAIMKGPDDNDRIGDRVRPSWATVDIEIRIDPAALNYLNTNNLLNTKTPFVRVITYYNRSSPQNTTQTFPVYFRNAATADLYYDAIVDVQRTHVISDKKYRLQSTTSAVPWMINIKRKFKLKHLTLKFNEEQATQVSWNSYKIPFIHVISDWGQINGQNALSVGTSVSYSWVDLA